MKNVKMYVLTLKHDKGFINIMVTATSKANAIFKVTEAELCPKSAIKKVCIV